LDAHPGPGQFRLDRLDRLARLLDEAHHVPPADVERDVVPQSPVLALDHARAVHHADVGDHAQRDLHHAEARRLYGTALGGASSGLPLGPNTFTPTCVLTPVASMFTRLMIGCVQTLPQPGIWSSLSISFTTSSLVFCHRSSRGDNSSVNFCLADATDCASGV